MLWRQLRLFLHQRQVQIAPRLQRAGGDVHAIAPQRHAERLAGRVALRRRAAEALLARHRPGVDSLHVDTERVRVGRRVACKLQDYLGSFALLVKAILPWSCS